LGSLFQARTRGVLHQQPAYDNIWYLMGALIGDELMHIHRQHAKDTPILVAASPRFSALYREVANRLDPEAAWHFAGPEEMKTASTLGHRLFL